MRSATQKRKATTLELLARFPASLPLRLTLDGAPRTKKNHGQRRKIGNFVKTIPSAQWLKWRDSLAPKLTQKLFAARVGAIAQPVNCSAIFYRDAERGDLVGYMQGLADLLEDAGVVADDIWIMGWDSTRMLKDSARPRVELVLTPIGD